MSDDNFEGTESAIVNIFLMLIIGAFGLLLKLIIWLLGGSDGSTEDSSDDNNSDGNNSD